MNAPTLSALIDQHNQAVDALVALTQKIVALTQAQDVEGIIFESENRERLCKIIGKIQERIMAKMETFSPSQMPDETKGMIRRWSQRFGQKSSLVDELDQAIVSYINEQMGSTKSELNALFKNRQLVKSYNLKNISK